MKVQICATVILLLAICAINADREHPRMRSLKVHKLKNEAERSTQYWMDKAQSILADKLKALDQTSTKRAKNIIMFLGDGMSVHTITASRNLKGDSSEQLSFEKFPTVGLSKTYCVDRQVSDSACTATAYLGGVKGNYGTIGVNANAKRYNCQDGQNPANYVEGLTKWAQDAGMATGLVTTARVTHASPAGVYAHTTNRNWENDYEVTLNQCNPSETIDIARQLVEWPVGKKLNVIMGGGRRNFLNTTVNDEEGIPGMRTDGRNLIKEWLAEKQSRNASAAYAWSRKGLSLVDLEKTEHVLGLFSSSHCPFHGDLKRGLLEGADPSLSEMTAAAIKVMQKNEKGFFLFVEGARIDMAHHETWARKSLEDTVELATAVERALEMTNPEETLIVVTSDHSHTMTINGYPYRDQDITGLADDVADDGKPYTILSYANGPGFYSTYSKKEGRNEISTRETRNPVYEYNAAVPLNSETHGGDDVAVFAHGPYAHFFSGNYEQTNIPAMMAKAAQIGPFANVQ